MVFARKHLPILVSIGAALALVGIAASMSGFSPIIWTKKHAASALVVLAPTAERAYAHGLRQFDARQSAWYDVDAAEENFRKTLVLDPEHPYVYHQLARVEFLRGDFREALRLIDIQIERHPDATPSAHYMRGLILGFMGAYDESAHAYEHYLQSDPNNWAAINDYAWVLLKGGRFHEAARVLEHGIAFSPDNPWLLNSYATALYEMSDNERALAAVERAQEQVAHVKDSDWLKAYPGNDPRVAEAGIAAFKKAVEENMHTIRNARGAAGVESNQ